MRTMGSLWPLSTQQSMEMSQCDPTTVSQLLTKADVIRAMNACNFCQDPQNDEEAAQTFLSWAEPRSALANQELITKILRFPVQHTSALSLEPNHRFST